jgi:hypothetical protein
VGFRSKISLKSAHFGTKAHTFQKIWRFRKEFVNLQINKIGICWMAIMDYEL